MCISTEVLNPEEPKLSQKALIFFDSRSERSFTHKESAQKTKINKTFPKTFTSGTNWLIGHEVTKAFRTSSLDA